MSEFKIFAFLTTLSLISLGICYRYPNPLKTTMIPTNNYGIKFDKGSDKGSTWELSKSIISQSSDINKDGASDLMICSPDAPTTSSETQGGEVYIVYGANSQTLSGEILLPNQLSSVVSSGSLSKINGIYIKSTLYNQSVGSSGAIVGDINGDSTSDFIIGAPGSNVSTFASAGKVYIVLGATHNGNRETEIQSSTTNIIEGKSAGLHLGKQVTGLGDVNGDGLDDFAVGSSSQVYIFFGSSTAGHFNSIDLSSLSSSQGILILGFEFEFIQNLGDINNDGINDIGLGVPSADDNQGKIIVIFGRKNGDFPAQINVNSSQFTSETGFIVKGVTKNLKIGGLTVYSGDQLGSSFSNAGDINNDGINDFIIGGSDQLNKYYVIYGSETNNFPLTTKDLAGSKGFAINGQAGDGCGKSAALLDISGDGIVDLILGAPLANNSGKANSGRVYVIYGRNFTSDFNLSEINGNNGFVILSYTEDMKFGSSVAALGDFNTDGSQDFLIGTKTGSAYLIYGHGKQFYTCHATCKTCNGADADNCLTCITGRYFFDNTCLTSCPSTTIQNQDSMICQQCPDYKFMQIETSNGVQYRTCQSCSTNCKTCSAANSTSCLSCSSGYYLFNSECKQCTIGNCGTCFQENHCSQCNSGYYLHQDETTLNYSCKQCDSSCLSCKGEGAQLCINCLIGYFFQIIGEGTGSCTQCAVVDEEIEKAKESENITSSNETSENNNDLRQLAILSSNACQVCADAVKCQTCSDFNFVNNDGKCQKCNSRCRKCTGPYYQNCTICNDGFYYNYITQLCEACYYGCQICKNNICSACTLGFNLTNGVCVQDENKYANYFEVEDAPYPEIKYSKLILVIAVLATVIATIIGILILFSQMIMNCYIKWKEKREEKKREVDQEIDLTKPLTLERTQFYSRNILYKFKQELNSINEKTVQLIGEFGQNTVKMKALENGIYEIKKLSAKKKDEERKKLLNIDKNIDQIQSILNELATLESGGLQELGKIFKETLKNQKEISQLENQIRIQKLQIQQEQQSEEQQLRDQKNQQILDNLQQQLQNYDNQFLNLKQLNDQEIENLNSDITDSFNKFIVFENNFKSKFLKKEELHTPQFLKNLLSELSRTYISYKVKNDLLEVLPQNSQLLEIQTQLDFLPLLTKKFIQSQDFKINHSQQIGSTGETYEGSILNKQTGQQMDSVIKQSYINSSNIFDLYKRLSQLLQTEHKSLIKIYGINVIEVSEKKYRVTVVMEKLNSNLFDIIIKQKESIKFSDKIEIILSIVKGLKHLHKLKIPHRNLKLSNILTNMTRSIFKLSEISIYSNIKDLQALNFLAPLKYHPLDSNPKNTKYDIWQLGLLIYEIIVGRFVWESVQTPLEMENLLKERTKFFSQHQSTGNQKLDQVIESCLNYEVESRISLDNLLNDLKNLGN